MKMKMKMNMQMIEFVTIVNVIQMKLMKVSYNIENSSIPEFQQNLESILIEMMMMKIPQMRLHVNESSLQMKSMKLTSTLTTKFSSKVSKFPGIQIRKPAKSYAEQGISLLTIPSRITIRRKFEYFPFLQPSILPLLPRNLRLN
jgi:hypothetical protein